MKRINIIEIVIIIILIFGMFSCDQGNNPSTSDITPPNEVDNLIGIIGDNTIILSWSNPHDSDVTKHRNSLFKRQ
jgi:hypothetical protein